MAYGLEGKVILITGSASGIGKGIAKRFLKEGSYPVLIDINEIKLNRTISDIANNGVSAEQFGYLTGDIRDRNFRKKVISYVDEKLSTIDVLVNCAGIFPSGSALQIEESEWDDVFNVNVKSVFFLTQEVVNYMVNKKVENGCVINITSAASEVARPGISHYASSKAALKMLTQVLALEFATYGIRVNALGPGLVETDTLLETLYTEKAKQEHEEKVSYCPLGRTVNVSEIADAVMFLAGNQSSFITGQNILIDGGYSAGRVYKSFS